MGGYLHWLLATFQVKQQKAPEVPEHNINLAKKKVDEMCSRYMTNGASPLLSLLLQNLICDSKRDQKSGTHTPSPTHTHFFLLSSILTYFFGRYPPPLLSKFLDPLPLISPSWDSVRRGLLYLPVRDLRKAVRERQAGGNTSPARGARQHLLHLAYLLSIKPVSSTAT